MDDRELDESGVDSLAAAMKEKLAAKRRDGYGGWSSLELCPPGRLARLLHEHLDKGDPVDIANFAMMLHARGERTWTPLSGIPDPDGFVELARACIRRVAAVETDELGCRAAAYEEKRRA